jgi:hypothetical protein
LRNAEIAIVVEGEDDRVALHALLADASKRIGTALQTGMVAIDTLQGGTNLSYKLGQLRETLCSWHVLLDHDKAGVTAYEKAHAEGLLSPADVTHVICPNLDESEFEDMLEEHLYAELLKNQYTVSLATPKFKGKSKWSDRLRAAFLHQGKLWSPKVEMEIKAKVAELVAAAPSKTLNLHKRGPFDGLVTAIEGKLDCLSAGR